MIEIKSPEKYKYNVRGRKLFLAGGISNCMDWQRPVVDSLIDTNLVLFNPRKNDFSYSRTNEYRQIEWEAAHLDESDAILFWFPPETVCPITLFEYGKWLTSNKKLFVGTHPAYLKRLNLQVQTKLVRPEINIKSGLDELIQDIIQWSR